MSLRTRVVVSIVTLSSLAFLVACGSSTNKPVPPPTGGFTNSNLKGTYVFSVTGSDFNGFFFTQAGTFTADGNGNITGGTIELNDAGAGVLAPQAVTSGVYSVAVDGRGGFNRSGGGLMLQTAAAGTFIFDFVLSSSTHGLITEFDTNGSGSGTLDLQSSVSQAQIAGSYAFNLSGVFNVNTSTGAQTPFGTVGNFTLDSTGNITAGAEDFNENGFSSGLTNLPYTSGFVDLSTVPGTAALATSAGSFHFDVYPVDASHLKFIETDALLPISAGDAFTQTSSIATTNVFTLAGFDSTAGGPFTAAGLIVTDGAGNVTSSSAEDINDFGLVATTPIGFTGNYSAVTAGRSVFTFVTGFVNGNNGIGCTNCAFAAYPSAGGLQLLEIDNGGTTTGIAYAQSATSLSTAQGYGMNLAGVNFGNLSAFEEDAIAEFTNNNGSFTGLIDFNDQGATTPNQKFTSSYTADSTISGRGVISPGSNAFNLVSYVVDGSSAVFIETDSNQVGLGSFSLQNASAQSSAVAARLAVARISVGAKRALRRR